MEWFLPLKWVSKEEFKKMYPVTQEVPDEDIKFECPSAPTKKAIHTIQTIINHHEGEKG